MGLRAQAVAPGAWGSTPWFVRQSLTCFGLGYLPASGTWGSIPPCAMALLLGSVGTSTAVTTACVVLCGLWGAVACLRFGDAGERAAGRKDPGIVVADEVAGMALMLIWLPPAPAAILGVDLPWWAPIAAAFFLFRVLDVAKLPPVHAVQSLPGGVGILVDDLLAAAQGWILLQVGLRWLLPTLAA